jgi:uncharacterized lipoprotein YddW (UPF0748 family)
VEKALVCEGVIMALQQTLRRCFAIGHGLICAVLLAACAAPANEGATTAPAPPPAATPATAAQPITAPPLPREFRAAWVATVANIDWPSKPGLSAEALQAEIGQHVQTAKSVGLNALLLQVRANADAIYPSALEPWADVLTGTQGQAPQWADKTRRDAFDPLQAWIDASRFAGIELHVWFNPYRARHTAARSESAASHISKTRPHLVKTYGGFGWLDPGEPAAAEHSLAVMGDVVTRYDIDGVHIDDYFYPYPVTRVDSNPKGGTVSVKVDFPDEPSWQAYTQAGGNLSRADWRRDNVNRFVQTFDARMRSTKPWVQVGVSPFGLGKPALRPDGIKGFSQFDELYADVELWLDKGWMDYLAPQLYWPIAQRPQAFDVLLDYWAQQNPAKRHIYSGLYTSRIDNSTRSWTVSEITDQIGIQRQRAQADALLSGHVHFSLVAIAQNRKGVADALRSQYAVPALPPVSARVPADTPLLAAPAVTRSGSTLNLALPANSRKVALWERTRGQWQLSLHGPVGSLSVATGSDAAVVSVLDRFGRESARSSVALQP